MHIGSEKFGFLMKRRNKDPEPIAVQTDLKSYKLRNTIGFEFHQVMTQNLREPFKNFWGISRGKDLIIVRNETIFVHTRLQLAISNGQF